MTCQPRNAARLLAGLTVTIALAVVATGCAYIVPPPEDHSSPTPALSQQGWTGLVTGISEASGSLHVDLAIENTSGDWSAMNIAASKARVLDGSGKAKDCGTVFVGTSVFVNDGGWYLPPGFVMKGYTAGTTDTPKTQLLYVECAGVAKAEASKLQVDYTYITGAFNYYTPSHPIGKTMNLDLTKPVTTPTYPMVKVADKLVEKQDTVIKGVNDYTVQLTAVKRTDTGFEFSWKSTNQSDYQNYAPHIGEPPVIGRDGILYGFYQSPHLAQAPITPSKGEAAWTTTVQAPKDGAGFYILLPVETQQQSYFVDHVLDITNA